MAEASIIELLDKLKEQAERFDASLAAARGAIEKRESEVDRYLSAMTAQVQQAAKELRDGRAVLLAGLDQQLARIPALSSAALAGLAASAGLADARAKTMLAKAQAMTAAGDALAQQLATLGDANGARAQEARKLAEMMGNGIGDALTRVQQAQQRNVNGAAQTLKADTLAAAGGAHDDLTALISATSAHLGTLGNDVDLHLKSLNDSEEQRFGTTVPAAMAAHEEAALSAFASVSGWMDSFDKNFGGMNDEVRKQLDDIANLINAIRPVLDVVKQVV